MDIVNTGRSTRSIKIRIETTIVSQSTGKKYMVEVLDPLK